MHITELLNFNTMHLTTYLIYIIDMLTYLCAAATEFYKSCKSEIQWYMYQFTTYAQNLGISGIPFDEDCSLLSSTFVITLITWQAC